MRADIDLSAPQRIHIVGVGGAGMSAIATVLAQMGHTVTGSDLKGSPGTARLAGLGIEIQVGHRAEAIGDAELVTFSTAIPEGNPELSEARERGIPVLRRAEILSAIASTRRTIAVAGTHGKTTTSSMLALVLIEAGMQPSFIVGGEVNEIGTGAAWDSGEWFVIEADESDGTFLELGSEAVIVTSIEPDHLEHYGSYESLVEAFTEFVVDAKGPRVVCADYADTREIAARHGAITYGFGEDVDFRIVDYVGDRSGARFSLERHGDPLGPVSLPVPGRHNAANAAATVALAMELGVPFETAVRALARYGGVARRFEFRGEHDGVTFVDEYSHLPTEVAAAISAAREGGWARLVCVFQPHRYSRTAAVWREFSGAFAGADVLVVTDVYAAGETPRPGITGKLIVDAVLEAHPDQHMVWLPARGDLAQHVAKLLRPGDLCLTLGAGDLTLLPDEILALSER